MGKVKDKLKAFGDKIDKKALGAAIGIMLLSWAALPIIYWLLVVKKQKPKKEKVIENGNME